MIFVSSPAAQQRPQLATMTVTADSKKVAAAEVKPPVELKSAYDFSHTLTRLKNAIEGAGMKIFARIDHRAEAAAAGLQMQPATVLIYGNPKAGTPLMQAAPSIALDLPLRVLVRESLDGTVLVSFHSGTGIVESAGLGQGYAANLSKAEQVIAAAIGS